MHQKSLVAWLPWTTWDWESLHGMSHQCHVYADSRVHKGAKGVEAPPKIQSHIFCRNILTKVRLFSTSVALSFPVLLLQILCTLPVTSASRTDLLCVANSACSASGGSGGLPPQEKLPPVRGCGQDFS